MKQENKENKENKAIKVNVRGILCKCRYERGYKGKGDKQWRISVKVSTDREKMKEKVEKILDSTGIDISDVFTPKWLKDVCADTYVDGELYVNTHTAFDVPTVRRINGCDTELDFETELFEGADVIMTLNCKPTGVYPGAILVLENGKPYNPFEGINEEDV